MEAKPYSIEEVERSDWGTLQGPRLRTTVQALAAATQRAEKAEAERDEARRSRGVVEANRDMLNEVKLELLSERDALKADLARAQARVGALEVEVEDSRAEVLLAQEAMGNGADDSRWSPGETAVVALIRERDALRAKLAEVTAAREEQREADALSVTPGEWNCDGEDIAAEIRKAPLTATPLADEIARLTKLVEEYEAESECQVDGRPQCKKGDECRACLVAMVRQGNNREEALRAALETAREALVRSGRALKAILDLTVGVPDMRIPAIALDIGDEITAALAALDAVKTGAGDVFTREQVKKAIRRHLSSIAGGGLGEDLDSVCDAVKEGKS